MEFDPKDRKVVELLTGLKSVNGGYPPEMLASRRQAYLNQVAGIGIGAGAGMVLKNAVKRGARKAFSSTAGTLLETALVVAIVAEASTVTYFYRDKLAHIFQSISGTSNIQEVTSPPVVTSPLPGLEVDAVFGSITPTGNMLGVPTGTPVPGLNGDLVTSDNGGTDATNSTPGPNGNNGNHYGQTPKPDRTKVNSGNNDNPPEDDSPNGGNTDKPPKGNK